MGIQDFFASLFGDAGFSEPRERDITCEALSKILPYEVFDPEKRLYFNDHTIGFIFEVFTTVQSDALQNFHGAIQSSMPVGSGLQILNWSSPDISRSLEDWARARVGGGDIGEAMAAARVAHLQNLRFGTTDAVKALPLNRRRFVVGWVPSDSSKSAVADLDDFRRAILGAIGMDQTATILPWELITLAKELLHAENWSTPSPMDYSDNLPISAQLYGSSIKVTTEGLTFNGKPQMSARVLTASKYPNEWETGLSIVLSGEPDRISDRPHGPVLMSLNAQMIPVQKATAGIIAQRAKMEHSKKTGFAKFATDLGGKEQELHSLAEELENGEKLLSTVTTVVCFAQGGVDESRAAAAEMMKIWRRAGIILRHERYLQLPIFMNALPMGAAPKQMATLGKMMRTRLLKGAAVAALAPFHSEWKGNSLGEGVLLVGRQGQVFTWSNFISEGNYNASVVGKSGAGKSVFMQELVSSLVCNGGRCLVIDDGYSFQTMAEIMGGRHVALDGSAPIRLNPFSMLDADRMDGEEYAAEAVELLARVISTMGALGEQREGRVSNMEEGFIADAVKQVWAAKGSEGQVGDVYELLLAKVPSEPRLKDVCQKLSKFIPSGTYGAYFEGPSNITLDTPLTVIELSDIKTQPELEQVVLQIVMFLGTELMYKTDRSVRVAIVIDEAWSLLRGAGTAHFIEGVVRRARKYTGALITGTQSVDDYYDNPAALVCLQNSDWQVFLAQKPETIDRLEADGRLSAPPGTGRRLKSLTSVPGQFSELAIKGSEGWVFGRLLLDAFSLTAVSSKGSTVAELNRLKSEGLSTVEAVGVIAKAGTAQ